MNYIITNFMMTFADYEEPRRFLTKEQNVMHLAQTLIDMGYRLKEEVIE